MVSCIIVAAGSGKRMGTSVNKVFLDIDGRPVLFHTIAAFEKNDEVSEIIPVIRKEDMDYFMENIYSYGFKKLKKPVEGGSERFYSVKNGVSAVDPQCDVLLIHDGARPFVSERIITDCIRYTRQFGAACPGIKVRDTIKIVDEDGFITGETDREVLRAVQTPQGFDCHEFITFLNNYTSENTVPTDDTTIFYKEGKKIYIFEGDENNLKFTTPNDYSKFCIKNE